MPNSAIDICNRALTMIGASTITSFVDGNTEANVAAQLYESCVEDMLSRHRWRFSTRQEQISRLVTPPTNPRWAAAYAEPADMIVMHVVTVNGFPIEYDRYQNEVHCNATDTDVVIADYTYRSSEGLWPPTFVTAMELQLASLFAVPIGHQEGLSDRMEKRAMRQTSVARTVDSQSQTTRKLHVKLYESVRRTTRPY